MINRIFMLMKCKKGNATVIMAMSIVLFLSIFAVVVATFAFAGSRITHVRNTSQNTIDVYTIKTGRKIMSSIKNGHDFSKLIDEQKFLNDLIKQLNVRNAYKGYDENGDLIYEVKDIELSFIYDASLKTELSYTLVYNYYFAGECISSYEHLITQHSLYNLKYN